MSTTRRTESNRGRRLAALLVVAALLAPAVGGQAPSGTLVLEYHRVYHLLEDRDPLPLLRIYADGRVLVHHPIYMARAGDYELQLTQAELTNLFDVLEGQGLRSFDPIQTSQDRDAAVAADAARGTLSTVTDRSETVIRIRGQVQGGALQASAADAFQEIRWDNVVTDAARFPGVAGVQSLNLAEQQLQQIVNRGDLQRLP